MSDSPQTWRVVGDDGNEDDVLVERDHHYWHVSRGGAIGGAAGWPRAAVAKLLGECHGSAREILAPGELSATEREAAAFEKGVEAMRALAVRVCREVEAMHGVDVKRRGWPAQVGAGDCRVGITNLPVPEYVPSEKVADGE